MTKSKVQHTPQGKTANLKKFVLNLNGLTLTEGVEEKTATIFIKGIGHVAATQTMEGGMVEFKASIHLDRSGNSSFNFTIGKEPMFYNCRLAEYHDFYIFLKDMIFNQALKRDQLKRDEACKLFDAVAGI